jgi:hypothetical protein
MVVVVAVAAVVASSAFAADAPFERPRGGIPPADDGIIATLLRLGAPVTDRVVTVAAAVDLDCVNQARTDGRRLDPKVASHFAWYYPDCPTSPSGLRCRVEEDVLYLGSVELGPELVGFLFRVPGLFTSSVVDLWPYDRTRRRWLTPVELVDNWGDPDQWYLARAWLVDLDGDGYRDIVKREKIGAGGRLTDDRLTMRPGGPDGFVPARGDRALHARFDFTLACR